MQYTAGSRRFWPWIGAVLGLAVVAGVVLLMKRAGGPDGSQETDLTKKSFDGSSQELERTVVVPTLDTPFADGVSAIWCCSFQIAWNHMKTDVTREPVQVRNAEVMADRLNRAEQSENDLAPESYYAAAGLVRDGVVDRIQAEMSRKFRDMGGNVYVDAEAVKASNKAL